MVSGLRMGAREKAEKMGICEVKKRMERDGGLKLRLWNLVYQYTIKVAVRSEKTGEEQGDHTRFC
jgi:hypothetical protein